MAASLAGLWLRAFADAAAARHYLPALLAGLAIALSLTVAAAVEYAGNRTKMSLSDRTQYLLNRRLLEIIGRSPTLAIHQTPAHLRELELLQLESWEFAQAVPALIEAITIAVQVAVTVALLASISPLMLIMPLFGLPALALSRQTAGLFNLGNELAAEPSRRAEMLYYLAANSSAAAELRLFRQLDEPTAAIDAEAEHELFARWTKATRASRQRTGALTVLVSHRLATVRTADLILVLQDGRICEQGSHSDLMDFGGRYAALFDLQARAYRYGPTG